MAERKVTAKSILLFLDLAGGVNYKLLICLTSDSLKRATSIIDAASFCGPDSQPGSQTVSIDFAGQRMLGPDAGNVSSGDLHDAWVASSTVGWKIGPAVPVAGDEIYSGTGFVATLEDTNDMTNTTFTGTLAVYGIPLKEVKGSGGILTLAAPTAGTLYTDGFYANVPLTGGTGTGATANITVAGAAVTIVEPVTAGLGYTAADSLSALAANIGGTGSGFAVVVSTVE